MPPLTFGADCDRRILRLRPAAGSYPDNRAETRSSAAAELTGVRISTTFPDHPARADARRLLHASRSHPAVQSGARTGPRRTGRLCSRRFRTPHSQHRKSIPGYRRTLRGLPLLAYLIAIDDGASLFRSRSSTVARRHLNCKRSRDVRTRGQTPSCATSSGSCAAAAGRIHR